MLTIFLVTIILAALIPAGLFAWSLYLVRCGEQKFPPLGQFIEIGQTRLHYLASGVGPPIVLLHGANSTLHDWQHGVRQGLEGDFHVVAFDRPGHGYSDAHRESPTPAVQADILHEAFRNLGLSKPIVVGFSWSGSLAMAYGLAYPDDVSGIVSLAGAVCPWPGGIDPIYEWANLPVFGPLLAHAIVPPYATGFAAHLSKDVFAPQALGLNLQKLPIGLATRPKTFLINAAERRLLKRFLQEQYGRYAEFRAPLLIIHGTEDRIVSREVHALPLTRTIPGAVLREIPNAGHALPYTHPEEVVAAIRDFAANLRDRPSNDRVTPVAYKARDLHQSIAEGQ